MIIQHTITRHYKRPLSTRAKLHQHTLHSQWTSAQTCQQHDNALWPEPQHCLVHTQIRSHLCVCTYVYAIYSVYIIIYVRTCMCACLYIRIFEYKFVIFFPSSSIFTMAYIYVYTYILQVYINTFVIFFPSSSKVTTALVVKLLWLVGKLLPVVYCQQSFLITCVSYSRHIRDFSMQTVNKSKSFRVSWHAWVIYTTWCIYF